MCQEPTMVATGNRVPRLQGTPFMMRWSETTRDLGVHRVWSAARMPLLLSRRRGREVLRGGPPVVGRVGGVRLWLLRR